MSEKKLPLKSHLKELRRVLLVSAAAVLLSAILIYGFLREPVMQLIVGPVRQLGVELIFTGVSEAFVAYIKVSLWGGIVCASPIILWQVLTFVLPGLYRRERRRVLVMIAAGSILFVAGLLFGYFLVFQFALNILLFDFSGSFVTYLTISNYLGFAMKFLLPFGLVFEIPLFVYALAYTGLVTAQMMRAYRKYVLVVILIIAAFLTPPDVVSQMMLATPMLVLYEVSIFIAQLVQKRKQTAPLDL